MAASFIDVVQDSSRMGLGIPVETENPLSRTIWALARTPFGFKLDERLVKTHIFQDIQAVSYVYTPCIIKNQLLSKDNSQAHKESEMNFTCKYTTPMDFEPLNPNPVSEFPLDPPVFR